MGQHRSNRYLKDEIPDFGFYGIDVRQSELSHRMPSVSGNRRQPAILGENKKPGDYAGCI
jgi:hypothetical protein